MSANIKRYRRSFVASQILADIMEIDQYPIDMFEVLSHVKKILVSSFSDYKSWAQSSGRDCPDELQEAKCYYDADTGMCIIIYNEKKPQIRIRFSLAHELAHIILGHLNDKRTEIDRGGLDDIAYYAMEGAANTFAGNFLAPPVLIHEFLAGSVFDVDKIAKQFNLSKQSVQVYRKQDYQYWLTLQQTKWEQRILIRCKRRYYTFLCSCCGHCFSIELAIYCPICGNQIKRKRLKEEEIMGRTYPGIELNANGQVKECILCGNVEYPSGSEYCMICGKPIVNRCTYAISDRPSNYEEQCSHSEPLPSNARYCPYCGNQTTFFRDKLLLAWNEELGKSGGDDGELPLPF